MYENPQCRRCNPSLDPSEHCALRTMVKYQTNDRNTEAATNAMQENKPEKSGNIGGATSLETGKSTPKILRGD